VQRWLKFAKHLPALGWQPVIFTPQNPAFDVCDESLLTDIPPEAEVIKIPIFEPYRLLRSKKNLKQTNFGVLTNSGRPGMKDTLLRWIRGNIMVPDPRVFWVQPSLRYLLRYLKTHPVDAVVSTGPPHSMHLIGLGLKKTLHLGWIADFRDPWSKLDLLDDYKIMPPVRRRYERMEQEVLLHADVCLTVSKCWGDMFAGLGAKKVEVITNGYAPEDIISAENNTPAGFVISHFGLMNHLRNPLVLWKVIEEKLTEDADFRNDFKCILGGHIDPEVLTDMRHFELLFARTKVEGYLSHSDLQKVSTNSAVLLLLCFKSEIGKGNIPGKLFEYLAIGRPILAFGGKGGDVDRILRETGGGTFLGYAASKLDVSAALDALYSHYKHGKFTSKPEGIDAYERAALTGNLVKVLDRL
jgi:glycosyltransferase involved in cell wall biosynthesis